MKEYDEEFEEVNKEFFKNREYTGGKYEDEYRLDAIEAGDVRKNSQNILDGGLRLDLSSGDENAIYEDAKEKAANLIVADLLTKKRNFEYGGMLYRKYENIPNPEKSDDHTILKSDELESRISRYKEHLFEDPSFKDTLKRNIRAQLKSPGLTGSNIRVINGPELVGEYKRTRKEKLSELTSSHYYDDPSSVQIAEKKISLSFKQNKMLTELRDEMLEYNHKEVRKGVNAKMMKALNDVLEKSENNTLTMQDMDELRKRAARYYSDRKGTLFGPRTGEGKNRLNAAGRIFRTADAIIELKSEKLYKDITRQEEKKEIEKIRADYKKKKLDEQAKEEAAQKQSEYNKQILDKNIKQNETENAKLLNYFEKDDLDKRFDSRANSKGEPINGKDYSKMFAMMYVREYVKLHGVPKTTKGVPVKLGEFVGELMDNKEFQKAIGCPDPKSVKDASGLDFDKAKSAVTAMSGNDLKMRKNLAGKLRCLDFVKSEKDLAASLKPKVAAK